jgi:hypothetical protein
MAAKEAAWRRWLMICSAVYGFLAILPPSHVWRLTLDLDTLQGARPLGLGMRRRNRAGGGLRQAMVDTGTRLIHQCVSGREIWNQDAGR